MRSAFAKTVPAPFRLAFAAACGLGLAAMASTAHAGDAAPATRPIPYAAIAAPAAPGDVEGEIASAARTNGLDPALVRAVALQESGLRREARSNKGAMGVMQLTADTAKDLHQNIQGGAAYLRTLIVAFGGDVAKALAAYNAGPGAVMRYNGVPPFAETRNYVNQIMARVAVGAVGAVSTPLPTQAARAALQVASTVKAAAQAVSPSALPNGSDPIGDALAVAMGR